MISRTVRIDVGTFEAVSKYAQQNDRSVAGAIRFLVNGMLKKIREEKAIHAQR